MPIVSSAIVAALPQKDGRRAVREQHSDNVGLLYFVEYLAEIGFDIYAALSARAVSLGDQIKTNEIQNNIQNAMIYGMMPTNNYSTQADNIAALRIFFATCSSWDAVRMGNFINGLNLSDLSLENVFGTAAPLANPSSAPTVVTSSGGSFVAATYSWKYTWTNVAGETLVSSNVTLAVTTNQKVTVMVPTLPTGAVQTNIYRGPAGSEKLVGNTVSTGFVDTGLSAGSVSLPGSNTTGAQLTTLKTRLANAAATYAATIASTGQ